MNRKEKRYFVYLLVLLIFGIGAVFWLVKNSVLIQKKAETEKSVLELEIWYPWTDKNELYEEAFLEAVSEYNQKNADVQLIPYGMEMEMYREKLPSDIASNDTPDIYYCFTEGYMENIVGSGRVLMLDDYMSEELLERTEEICSETMFDKHIYGLGFAQTVGVFLVNVELFEKYQIEVPQTWEQLLAVCRQFLDYGITPLACSEDNDIGFRMYLEALCMSEAGAENCIDIITGEKEADVEFTAGVEKFVRLLDIGAFGADAVQNNTHEVEEEFCLSKIPMYYTKNSFVGRIMQKNNPLYGKIRAIAFPGTAEDEILGGISDCFVVNAATLYPQECTAALEEIILSFSEKLKASCAGISIWEEVSVGTVSQEMKNENPVYSDLIEMQQNAVYFMPFWEFTVSGEDMKNYMEASRALFEGEIDANEFVSMITK